MVKASKFTINCKNDCRAIALKQQKNEVIAKFYSQNTCNVICNANLYSA